MGCLYKITSPSGKSYIGITTKTAEERWKVHLMRVKEGRNHAIQNAIRKYGEDNFSIKTLLYSNDWEYLQEMEKKCIVSYGTKSPSGYNLTDGGEGVVGRHITDEIRDNMSSGQKKRFNDPLELEKNRARQLEVHKNMSSERKKELSDMMKVIKNTPESRSHASQKTKEYMAIPENLERHRKIIKESLNRPEVREKMSNSQKLLMTDEKKKQISIQTKEAMNRPEVREKLIQSQKKRCETRERNKQQKQLLSIWGPV